MANEFKVKKGLIVNGSGSVILDVQGSQGQLFSITDSLSGSLFAVSDISGIPILEVFSDNRVNIGTFNDEAIKVDGNQTTIQNIEASGSFSGSYIGDGSQLSGISTDNFFVDGLLFNTSTGILTAVVSGSTDQTVDLDGRYLIDISGFSTTDLTEGTNLYYTDARVKSKLDTEGVISGSSQITITESQISDLSHYTHPTHPGDDFSVDSGALTGATVISDIDINVSTDTLGHVTDANGVVSTRTLTLADLGYTGETNATADQTITAGTDLTGGGTGNVTINHADTSTLSGTTGGAANGIVIEDITVDGRGHVTAIGTVDLDSRFSNYSTSDFNTDFSGKSTTDLSEGTNLYYTDARVKTKLDTEGVISGSSQITITESQISDLSHYTHPTYTTRTVGADTGPLTGATVVSDIDMNLSSDSTGHVTSAGMAVSTRNLTLANLGYTGDTNANNYTHPTHPGDDFSVDSGALTGATVISDIDINVSTDTLGHVTDANGVVSTRTLTLANLGYTGDTNAEVNQNAFSNVAVSGQSTIAADGKTDTLTVVAGSNVTITTDAGTDTLTIASTDTNTDTNFYLSGLSFNTGTGVLTGTVAGATNQTVDLDGRYLTDLSAQTTTNLSEGTNLYYTDARVKTKLDTEGVISGSSQVTITESQISDLSHTAPANNATITISAGTDLVTGGSFTTNQGTNGTITINHADTSTLSGTTGGAANGIVIEDITVDGRGHVTAIGTVDLDSRFNNYTHPTHPGDDFSVDTGALTGATVVSDIDINVTTDTLGHVTDANGVISTRSLTAGDIGAHPENTKLIVSDRATEHSGDSDTYTAFHAADSWRVVVGSTEELEVTSTAVLVSTELRATGDTIAFYSDERLKDIEGNIPNALDKIMSLDGFYYKENELAKQYGYDSEERKLGVSAQQVERVFPEVVRLASFDYERDDDGNETSKSGENYKTVQYEKLVPALIEAIKEQQSEINKLKKLIKG